MKKLIWLTLLFPTFVFAQGMGLNNRVEIIEEEQVVQDDRLDIIEGEQSVQNDRLDGLEPTTRFYKVRGQQVLRHQHPGYPGGYR